MGLFSFYFADSCRSDLTTVGLVPVAAGFEDLVTT
jgi:hypothetical protein